MAGSAETSQRLTCDTGRTLMRHDEEGRVVEVGARTRTDTFWTLPITGIVSPRVAAGREQRLASST
jgi:hypothetical protein